MNFHFNKNTKITNYELIEKEPNSYVIENFANNIYDFYYMQNIIHQSVTNIYRYGINDKLFEFKTADSISFLNNVDNIKDLMYFNGKENILNKIKDLNNYYVNFEKDRNFIINSLYKAKIFDENSVAPDVIDIIEIYKELPNYLNTIILEKNNINNYIKIKKDLASVTNERDSIVKEKEILNNELTSYKNKKEYSMNLEHLAKYVLVESTKDYLGKIEEAKKIYDITEATNLYTIVYNFISSNSFEENFNMILTEKDKKVIYRIVEIENKLTKFYTTIKDLDLKIEELTNLCEKQFANLNSMQYDNDDIDILENWLLEKEDILKNVSQLKDDISHYNGLSYSKQELQNMIESEKNEIKIIDQFYKKFITIFSDEEKESIKELMKWNVIFNVNYYMLFNLYYNKNKYGYMLLYNKNNEIEYNILKLIIDKTNSQCILIGV